MSLALIARRNFTCVTNNYDLCVRLIISLLYCFDDSLSWTEIDILKDYEHLGVKMTNHKNLAVPTLHNIIIWKNLENFDIDRVAKKSLLDLFDQLERYNTISSKRMDPSSPIELRGHKVIIPEIFLIVPVMVLGDTVPKTHPQIKARFWFCQSVLLEKYDLDVNECNWDLEECQAAFNQVYFDPEVREYVSSLMVFTRSHRMTSLAPLTSRPSLKATASIVDLCKALVVWNNRDERDRLFVTPDYVKVAYRKVCYWLVDWETNATFSRKDSELQRKLQISVLTGDWYGSEWHCVKNFIKEYTSAKDARTTTGFQNKIVDNVLESVLPPL